MQYSSGVIIVRKFKGVPKILLLRIYHNYDLPKGHIEEGESEFEAAIREVEEETGITELNFLCGKESVTVLKKKNKKKQVTLFLAESLQDPVIKPNPETGIKEHHGFLWADFDLAIEKVNDYMKPAIEWAKTKLHFY